MQNDPLDSTEPLARALTSTRTVLAQVTAGQLLAAGQTAIKPGYRGPTGSGCSVRKGRRPPARHPPTGWPPSTGAV